METKTFELASDLDTLSTELEEASFLLSVLLEEIQEMYSPCHENNKALALYICQRNGIFSSLCGHAYDDIRTVSTKLGTIADNLYKGGTK